MSDDSFIREVDEELRSERVQNLWNQYGKLLIAAAVSIVVGVGAYVGYQKYSDNLAAQAGDAFMKAVRLAETGKTDEALAAFGEIAKDGSPAYKALAQMRSAAELSKQGKQTEAVAAYDAVAQMGGADENLKAIARLRAGAILVDEGSVTEVQARVGPLSGPGAPYRASAREYLALAHYKAGDLEQAAKLFNEIRTDSGTPRAMSQRVLLMLELIASRGGPAVESAS